MADTDSDEFGAPKFATAGRSLKEFFTDYPIALLIIGIIILGLIYLFPIQTTTFVVTVGISVLMAWINFRIMETKFVDWIDLTDTEKTLISGGIAGTTGYIVGTWYNNVVVPKLNWSPLINQIDD